MNIHVIHIDIYVINLHCCSKYRAQCIIYDVLNRNLFSRIKVNIDDSKFRKVVKTMMRCKLEVEEL